MITVAALGRHAESVLGGELPAAGGYVLTADDRLRDDLIERLMCDFEVDLGIVHIEGKSG